MGQVRRPAAVKSNHRCPGPGILKDVDMKAIKTLTVALLWAAAIPVSGHRSDTDGPVFTCDTIRTSVITAEKGITVSRRDTVALDGNRRIEDAMLKIPGLSVNDNGGFSALKTVSLRGLGSSQTDIYIDGIKVGNLMSGQTDIGMLGMWNLGAAIVDYAQNRIDFHTSIPKFRQKGDNHRKIAGSLLSKGGSFGTFIPAISLSIKCSDNITASINSEGLLSESHRENSDIRQIKGGIDLSGRSAGGNWKAKAFANASNRQSPGSITYPYLSEQKDINSFIQSSFNKEFSSLYSLNLSGRIAYDDMKYTDSYSESTYGQTETRINTSHIFSIREWISISYALGINWNILKSNQYINFTSSDGIAMHRLGGITSGGISINHKAISAELALEYSGAADFSSQGPEGKYRHCLSPSASISIWAAEGLSLSAFGRRAYRIPTFNELYYIGFGNTGLMPENAWLGDFGAEWHIRPAAFWKLGLKADIFCNWLKDKITAAPSPDDPNIWLPYNIGKIRTAGTDICFSARYSIRELTAEGSVRYSFQDSQIRTPGSTDFGNAAPYTSRHTFIISGKAIYRGWGLEGIWHMREGRTDSNGALPGWNTLDFILYKKFDIKDICSIILSLDAKNVTDFRYEISRGYPMPGRALFGSFAISF